MKNKGLHAHRYENENENFLEAYYAQRWEEQNMLEILLSGEVTHRDQVVAATVIQWLGSPVGQSFVETTLNTAEVAAIVEKESRKQTKQVLKRSW